MKFLTFKMFLNESDGTAWKEMDFVSSGERSVHDVAIETLLTDDLIVICEDDDNFGKFEQLASTSQDGEKVLEITGHSLELYNSPFEFLKWEFLGASKEVIDTCFIVPVEKMSTLSNS